MASFGLNPRTSVPSHRRRAGTGLLREAPFTRFVACPNKAKPPFTILARVGGQPSVSRRGRSGMCTPRSVLREQKSRSREGLSKGKGRLRLSRRQRRSLIR